MPTVGSLFSGAGLLDLGLHLAGFQHAWLCESDPWRRDLLRARFLGVPVHDDIRTLRSQVAADAAGTGREQRAKLDEHAERELPAGGDSQRRGTPLGGLCAPVDLIAGGFPCKGASSAGKRNGFEHAETVLWGEMRRLVGELQPRVVLIENVGDIRGMAAAPGEPAGSLWGTVLGDLAALGFDAVWDCLPAAAIGAPHLRDRIFGVATHPDKGRWRARTERATSWTGGDPREDRSAAGGSRKRAAPDVDEQRGDNGQGSSRNRIGSERRGANPPGLAVDWGAYAPAIHRWEAIHGPAPEPLVRRMDDGDPGMRRVRARLDRSRLSALGDGVHVYCAWLVGRYVMRLFEDEAVAA